MWTYPGEGAFNSASLKSPPLLRQSLVSTNGSTSTIFPLRVPNLRLPLGADAVRTKSTTGIPRRQMVTASPFSAALISSGSRFFASATLAFKALLSHFAWLISIGEPNNEGRPLGRPFRGTTSEDGCDQSPRTGSSASGAS